MDIYTYSFTAKLFPYEAQFTKIMNKKFPPPAIQKKLLREKTIAIFWVHL